MNNRGVSPLIATIFLIAVAVAMGSIVMSLGQEYVNQQPGGIPPQVCTSQEFDVKTIQYTDSTSQLVFTIDNGGFQLDGFLIKVFNKDSTQGDTLTIPQVVRPFDVGIIRTEAPIEDVYEVIIIPREAVSGDVVVCQDKRKRFDATSAVFDRG